MKSKYLQYQVDIKVPFEIQLKYEQTIKAPVDKLTHGCPVLSL